MAYNEIEQDIIKAGIESGKSKDEIKNALIKYRSGYVPPVTQPTVDTSKPITDKIADFSKGAVKGFTRGAVGLAQGAYTLGQAGQAAIDPTRTFSEIREGNTEANPLDSNSQAAQGVSKELETNTPEEKAGDMAQLVGTLLYPTTLGAKAVGAGKAAGAVMDDVTARLGSLTEKLPEGSKMKEKILDAIDGLDDKTKTALLRTPKETFDAVVEQGRKAMLDDRNRTPLEAVGDSVAEALMKVKEKASQIGEQKSSLVKLPEAFEGTGIKSFNEGLQRFLNSRNLIENDKTIVKQIVAEFKNLGNTPTKGQVDKFIDFAQEALYAGEKNLTLPTSNKTAGGLKRLIGELNESLKGQMPDEYRALNDEYSRLATFTKELNTKLGKEAGNAGSLIKRLFSPSDARTKELFDLLEKETGQDFFRDARLAKFVMETLGDTRAASLLEQIPTSATGAVMKGLEWVKGKVTDPLKAAERFIKRNEKINIKDSAQANALAALPTTDDSDPDVAESLGLLGLAGIVSGKTRNKEAWKLVKALSKERARLVKSTTTNPDKNKSIQSSLEAIDRSIRFYSKDLL